MKKLLFLTTIFILAGCSKTKNNSENNVSETVVIDSHNIVVQNPTVDSGSEIPETEAVLFQFKGDIGEKIRKRFYIRNESGQDLNISNNFLDNIVNSFSISRNRCRPILKSGRSCYFDLELTYQNTVGDSSDKIFFLDGLNNEEENPFFNLLIDVDENYIQEVSASGDVVVKSDSVINFGTLKENESKTRRFYLINTSNILSILTPTLPALPNGVTLERNNCGSNINKLSSCSLDLKYDHQADVETLDETIQFQSINMSEINKSLTLQASNVAVVDENTKKLNLTTVDLPENTESGSIIRRIYISNALDQNYIFDNDEIFSGNGIELKNTCKNTSLRKNRYCYIDFQIDIVNDGDPIVANINIPSANVIENIAPETTFIVPLYGSVNYGDSNALFQSGNDFDGVFINDNPITSFDFNSRFQNLQDRVSESGGPNLNLQQVCENCSVDKSLILNNLNLIKTYYNGDYDLSLGTTISDTELNTMFERVESHSNIDHFIFLSADSNKYGTAIVPVGFFEQCSSGADCVDYGGGFTSCEGSDCFAEGSINGRELYVSNGDYSSKIVKDLNIQGSSSLNSSVNFNRKKIITSNEGLFVSDGTSEGTYEIKNPNGISIINSSLFQEVSGALYFKGSLVSGLKSEFFKISSDFTLTQLTNFTNDGSSSYTGLDINKNGGRPEFYFVNGYFYFLAHSAEGRHIWRTNGSSATQTTIVSGQKYDFTEFNNDLYYVSNNCLMKIETSNFLISQINSPGTSNCLEIALDSSDTGYSASGNGYLYLGAKASSSLGFELYKLDNLGNVSLVQNIRSGSESSYPEYFFVSDNFVFFSAAGNGSTNQLRYWSKELYSIDGNDTVRKLTTHTPSSNSSQLWRADYVSTSTREAKTLGDNIVFKMVKRASGSNDDQLYISNGLSATPILRNDGITPVGGSNTNFIKFGNKFFIIDRVGSDNMLRTLDSFNMASEILENPLTGDPLKSPNYFQVNNHVYISYQNSSNLGDLVRYDISTGDIDSISKPEPSLSLSLNSLKSIRNERILGTVFISNKRYLVEIKEVNSVLELEYLEEFNSVNSL